MAALVVCFLLTMTLSGSHELTLSLTVPIVTDPRAVDMTLINGLCCSILMS